MKEKIKNAITYIVILIVVISIIMFIIDYVNLENTYKNEETLSITEENIVEENINEEYSAPEFPYLIINSEPFTVSAKDGYDNAGFSTYICDSTDAYQFTAVDSKDVKWSVYILDEKFDDAERYISQAYEPDLEGDGSIKIEEGKYVYVYCSANAFTVDEAPEKAYLEITRVEEVLDEVTYETFVKFLENGFKTKWKNTDPESQGLSSVYNYLSEYTGFIVKDINGDDIAELLIGENIEGEDATVIYDIFTKNEDDEVMQVVSGGERDRFYICDNGIIVEVGSNSAEDSITQAYTLEDGSLIESSKKVTEKDYLKLDLESVVK